MFLDATRFFFFVSILFVRLGELAALVRTKVLDVDDTRLLQAGILDSGVLRIGNHTAVTSLGNAQTVDRSTGSIGDSIVELLAVGGEGDSDLFGELANRLAW